MNFDSVWACTVSKTRPALAWLAKFPSIKVVYKQRNFLDMAVDEYSELSPESAGSLPIKEVKNLFYNYWRQDDLLRQLIADIDYLTIDYEKLYFSTQADEWQRLWNYVSVADLPQQVTMDQIHKHAASWPRLPEPRNESIANYREVAKYIAEKPKYAKYLEPIPRVELPPIDWDAIDCVGTTETFHKCNLNSTQWGIPAILVGFGRSGSSVTWDTMAAMASYPTGRGQTSVEATGSGNTGALGQLQAFPHEHGKCWLERILCSLQNRNKRRFKKGEGLSAIYGTKWKASLRVFSHR